MDTNSPLTCAKPLLAAIRTSLPEMPPRPPLPAARLRELVHAPRLFATSIPVASRPPRLRLLRPFRARLEAPDADVPRPSSVAARLRLLYSSPARLEAMRIRRSRRRRQLRPVRLGTRLPALEEVPSASVTFGRPGGETVRIPHPVVVHADAVQDVHDVARHMGAVSCKRTRASARPPPRA